jgi:futalosine hydrolase
MANTDICVMQILVIAATQREIEPTIEFIKDKDHCLGDLELVYFVTGIGLLSATYSLMSRIAEFRPDCIIQGGIAGSFVESDYGKLLVVENDAPADIGVYEGGHFHSLFEMQLTDPNVFPYSGGFLSNPHEQLLTFTSLERVNAISVSEITTDRERIDWYKKQFGAVIESMEGAVLHYVCLCKKIPFLQIRSISNQVGQRDKTKWNIKESIDSLNKKLISLITELSKFDKTYLDEIFFRI